jgi:aromatic ring-opening dioxygenase LigB subunit
VSAPIALGAIMPHGDLGIAEACDDATRDLARSTQRAMDEAARRIAQSDADCVVVATPHGIHVAGHIAVVTAASAEGTLRDAAQPLSLTARVDTSLAHAITAAVATSGIPVVEVSYGGNSPGEAVMPLDWGSLVPLWHVQRHVPALPALIISPARELGAEVHIAVGAAIARAAVSGSRRLAFIASADQGHGHDAGGPYGFHPESAVFDRRVVAIVESGSLDQLLEISADEVRAALADSWWQMLMLVGALREDGAQYDCEVLAYEAPTYYGMLTAVVTPRSQA